MYFADLYCYYKVAIFELEMRKCTSRTRLVLLHSCDFQSELRKCTSLYYKVAIFELELRK